MAEVDYKNSVGAAIIIGALGILVDDEGMSPHQVFELIEQIKRDTFPALMEMYNENKNGSILTDRGGGPSEPHSSI